MIFVFFEFWKGRKDATSANPAYAFWTFPQQEVVQYYILYFTYQVGKCCADAGAEMVWGRTDPRARLGVTSA